MSSRSGRRAFLRGAAALGAGLSLGRAGAASPSRDEGGLVPRRLYYLERDYSNVRISPDGSQLAYLAPVGGIRNVFVAPLAAPRKSRQVTHATDRHIGWYEWAYTNRHIVYFQEHNGDENWRASSVDLRSGETKALTPLQGVRSFIQEASHLFPEEMLLRHNGRDRTWFDLYRVNVVTGAATLVYENNSFTWLITDSSFRLRLGGRYSADGTLELVERRGEDWVPFASVPIGDLDGLRLIDFSADGETFYMIDTRGRDKAALIAVDMASRNTRVLAADPEADIVRAGLDLRTRQPVVALAVKARRRWHALDSSSRKDLERVDAPRRGDLDFVNRSLDGRRIIVFHEPDTGSGQYSLLDRTSGRVTPLYKAHAERDRMALRPLQPVVIRARDGVELNSYLTLPERAAGARLPLVLAIHGGPYSRDSWGFSSTHQFLANRGYAVLSVNFRGSTGFGKAFVTAADKEWGGRMHDDLIDAVEWAVAQGIADPKRVCAYGASYGGYAALVAATRTPEVFACIVDIFGISNLLTFMATIPPYWKPWFSVWKNRLADPDTEDGRAFLRIRSPLFNLERATRPILVVQGMQDVRVVAAESEQMVAALERKGAPVTYVTFPDEGHGFAREENRLAFSAIVEAFLAKHLGGRYQPIGDDFAGSSLRVHTGAKLVPGLAETLKI